MEGQNEALIDIRTWDRMPQASVESVLQLLDASPSP
jgi:hypothetical protein